MPSHVPLSPRHHRRPRARSTSKHGRFRPAPGASDAAILRLSAAAPAPSRPHRYDHHPQLPSLPIDPPRVHSIRRTLALRDQFAQAAADAPSPVGASRQEDVSTDARRRPTAASELTCSSVVAGQDSFEKGRQAEQSAENLGSWRPGTLERALGISGVEENQRRGGSLCEVGGTAAIASRSGTCWFSPALDRTCTEERSGIM